jgi:hypothetical protein
MNKPLIFISHIAEESDIALALKDLIMSSFLGMIDVFVSSDYASISLGNKWLDDITKALKNCAVEIIICSPVSVEKQWINFEAGSGWIKEIPVIPLCHSGLEPAGLPIPLKLLQGAKATEEKSIKSLLWRLANAIEANVPNNDVSNFTNTVRDFELKYNFEQNSKQLRKDPTPQKHYFIVAKHSGKCLDVDGASHNNATDVYQYELNGGHNQQWLLVQLSDGYYYIVARHSGKVLDVQDFSKDDCAKIFQYQLHGMDNQKWEIQDAGGGFYLVLSKISGKALDIESGSREDAAMAFQYRVNGGDSQKWKFVPVEEQ